MQRWRRSDYIMTVDPHGNIEWRIIPARERLSRKPDPEKVFSNPQSVPERIVNTKQRIIGLRAQLRDHIESIIASGSNLDTVATAISEDLTHKIEAQERHLESLRKAAQSQHRATRARLPW
jgi:hypothetical protein